MRRSSFLVLPATLLIGSFFACGGRVDVPGGEGQPGPGPTGTTTPTGTSTTPGTPPTSTPTSSPTESPTTVPPSTTCSHTTDRLEITVSGAVTASCTGASPGGPPPKPASFTGEILKVAPESLTIDICPPTADCAGTLVTLTVKGAGLDLSTIPAHSLVTVDASFVASWGCTATVLVQSIAEWDGEKNPVDRGGVTYLVGGEGTTSVSGAPFGVSRKATGCMKPPPYPSCGGTDAPDDYELGFTGIGEGAGGALLVPMGGSGKFVSSGQVFSVRNLRSFYDGACDAYWDYAFWAKADVGMK